MPLSQWNLEFLNHNAQRSYPLTDESTKTDTTNSFTIPDDFIVGFIDGFTQLVAWTSDVIGDLPYYFGELIDGLMEFVSGMFSGDFLSTIFYAFANLGVELWGLIGNIIKLLWEIPWVIITKTWAWMTKLADRAWDMIKLKTGFMSQEAFDAKTLKDEQAEKALQA